MKKQFIKEQGLPVDAFRLAVGIYHGGCSPGACIAPGVQR